ncbi:MAG: hypothetical protein ACR2MW_04620 [Chthoniobacterales bacterium]
MNAQPKNNLSKSIVSYTRLGTIVSVFSLVATAMSQLPPTFDDTDRTVPPAALPGTPEIYGLPYPRLNLTDGATGNIKIASKYNTVSYGASQIQNAAALKEQYPRTMVLRYFPCSGYQSNNEGSGSQRPFLSTGAASVGAAVFAGHWLYLAGSRLTNPIESDALVLAVGDSSRFAARQYVVIYNGNPGDFLEAEHAQIASIDNSNNTLTLVARGYKSQPQFHPAGAVVAQHELGAGGDAGIGVPHKPESWEYNMGTRCPFDANGKQMNVVNAEWLASNLDLDRHGNPVGSFVYDGVLFDGERSYFFPDPAADMDNDLVADGGLNPVTGENMKGAGLEAFYAELRSLVGGSKILVGSNGNVRGYSSLNGAQCEGYPNTGTSYGSPPKYFLSDQKLASYSYHLHHHAFGPIYGEILSKTPTLIYPRLDNGGSPPTSNSPFRYSFGMALLENGSYGQRRPGVHGPWWDEYSVDVLPGSASFGEAIPNDDTDPAQIDKVRAHTGWLGSPLGPRTRIFDPALFDISRTLLPNGGFESGRGGWAGQNVKLSLRSGGEVFSGSHSLYASPMGTYSTDLYSASVTSPSINVASRDTYTLCFAVRSSQVREFGVQFGTGKMQTIVSGPDWLSHTLTFETDAGDTKISFYFGSEKSHVWLDEIYLLKGNPDIFRRDFDNGTVFVNATSVSRTVSPDGTFRRIRGTQDPINDGSLVGLQLTIPAYDAAVLVRVPEE